MKAKLIFVWLVSIMLSMAATDTYAQTRKTAGTRKTTTKSTTTRKKSTATAAAVAKPLTLEDVKGKFYTGLFMMDDLKKVGKDVGFSTNFLLSTSGDDVIWMLTGSKFDGSYSVTANKLTIKSGGLTAVFTSPDGGKTLKGTFNNNRGTTVPLTYYLEKRGAMDRQICENSFKNDSWKALMEVSSPRGEETVFPVVVTTTPNADGTGGTYKITVDNALGLGLIKGTYTISDTGVVFTSNLENCSTEERAYNKYIERIEFKLGYKNIDGSGKCSVYLRLFNQ